MHTQTQTVKSFFPFYRLMIIGDARRSIYAKLLEVASHCVAVYHFAHIDSVTNLLNIVIGTL